ncbi:MAG: AAA family ATPase [Sedimentisphaerales bacterium]|jgi:archaellum biogenesis ATPase FlaH
MSDRIQNTQADERLFSRAAEVAVIGSMIIDPGCIDKVSAIVGPDSFAFPENKTIYQAILDLRETDKPIDGFILRNTLEENKKINEIGGVDYLQKILDSVPSSANAEYYANIVKEKAQRRRLVEAHDEMKRILDSDEPVGECVSEIQQIAEGLDGAIEPSDSKPIIKTLADVKPLPIDWLWFNRIPLGMLTLILGDPGLGKSFLTLYMASRVSTGGAWPDRDGIPDNCASKGSVVILTAEDDLSHVVRPRLDALEADVTKIDALEGVKIKDENDREHCEYFNLQRDLSALQQAVRSRKDTKLVVIDPLSAYLGGRIDSHKDAEVRSVLRPLVELAEQCSVAVVGVTHLNKNANGKAVYRAMGSLAFLAAARTCWLVTADPNDPDSKRRLLTPAKHNVLIEPTGLAFEIVDGKVVFESEPVTLTADEALSTVSTIEPEALNKAKTWLVEQLPQGSAVTAADIFRRADEQGIKKGTLRRAKQELGVVSYALSSEGKLHWFWRIDQL